MDRDQGEIELRRLVPLLEKQLSWPGRCGGECHFALIVESYLFSSFLLFVDKLSTVLSVKGYN